MENVILWEKVLSAWHSVREDLDTNLLPHPKYPGNPTLTLWSEADMVFRFAHYLTSEGIPADWLHTEASMSGRKDDPAGTKADSRRRIDLVIADPQRLCTSKTGLPLPKEFANWRGQLFFEAKIVFGVSGKSYSRRAVQEDADKLERHVRLRRTQGGVLLIYSREEKLAAPKSPPCWYLKLAEERRLGALVHFEHRPEEDIIHPPPAFGG